MHSSIAFTFQKPYFIADSDLSVFPVAPTSFFLDIWMEFIHFQTFAMHLDKSYLL